jgi:5'-nucleotidase (lipoprotein e(P4) family)
MGSHKLKENPMFTMSLKKVSMFAVAFSLVACAADANGDGTGSTSQEVTTPAPSTDMADTVHWVRNSAEHRAALVQAYRLATWSLDSSVANSYADPGTWAVIVDGDETILDNSEYQKERGAQGWSADSWSAWVARKEAPALPGSVAFLQHVHDLGGKVVVVTNRSKSDCPATIANLDSDGLVHDMVLCQTDVSDKNPRFDSVSKGTAQAGVGPLNVMMWLGDNILDFPGEDQNARNDESRLSDFGSRFVVIPNPMYGSWTSNPRQ